MKKSTLKEINHPEQWINSEKERCVCSHCQDFLPGDYFHFSDGHVSCIGCIKEELRIEAVNHFSDYAYNGDIDTDIQNLQDREKVSDLIFSLITLPERIYGYDSGDEHYPALLENIVSLLGYGGHPLSQHIRQLAFNLCEVTGMEIVPYCKKQFNTSMWQFYCNTLMAAGIIEPTDKDVQKELNRAWDHEDENIRTFIQNVFKRSDFGIYHRSVDKKALEVLKTVNMSFTTTQENKVYSLDTVVSKKLYEFILEAYDLTKLKSFLKTYFSRIFIIPGQGGSPGRKKAMTKSEIAGMFAVTFSNKEVFDLFFQLLSGDAQEIFRTLVWRNQKLDLKKLEKKYNKKYFKNSSDTYLWSHEELKDDYSIFQYDKDWSYGGEVVYSLYINRILRKAVKGFFPAPEWSALKFQETFTASNISENERSILEGIEVMIQYLEHNPVSFTTTGKISVKYIKDFNKRCEVQEFFINPTKKEFQFIRTEILIRILNRTGKTKKADSPEIIKEIYNKINLSDDFNFFMIKTFLTYLKYDPADYNYYLKKENKRFSKKMYKAMTKLLAALKVGKWFTIDELLLSMDYNDELFYLIPVEYHEGMFYFNQTHTDYYNQRDRIFISEENYLEALFIPFMKAFFHFLAALGMADLAGSEPRNNLFHQNKYDYLTLYDGLEAARVTPLGAYVLGLSKNIPEVSAREEPFQIQLDSQFLLIQTKGSDRVMEFILNDIAETIKPGKYLITFNSFLANCKDRKDVEDKIALFREKIEKAPPLRFESFFREVLSRFNPMEEKGGYVLYKIKEDPLLIKLITEDPYLKKNILRAEDFHILIKKDKRNQVKQKLVKSGFFITS
ncbi:MAG: hypothetical protein JEY99_13970 [Spirochaetales bacterium]|nr:hypothetical protein [Spirochaetales bacterium]